MEAIKKSGFINYFGMQRFGTHSVPTHEIGKCLIKKNWVQAVKLILGQYSNDSAAHKAIKEYVP